MKKRICLLLAFVLFALSSARTGMPARAEEKETTVLVYICGSDLESESGQASDDIREMLSSGIGQSDDVSVLLATGGTSRWSGYSFSSRNVQYYRLDGGQPALIQDAGPQSMGSAGTLSGFLRFGLSSAPARRYILVLWDHGGGPVFGVCNDENHSGESLTLPELKQGLSDGLQGQKLDIIAFDCCLMNCIDLCADLSGISDYSVVSQEMVSGTGLDYDGWMTPLAADPSMSSNEVARLMAETYVADNAGGRRASTATMTVIDCGKMPEVMEAANAFSDSLAPLMQSNFSGVVRLRNQLTSFGEFVDEDASDLVDVSDLCDAFSALLPRECADLKQKALGAVCFNFTTDDIAAHAHGLSFFMPFSTVSSDRQEILSHYGAQTGSYAALAASMTRQVSSSGYTMSASSARPDNFYTYDEESAAFSGSFCDIWNGYYGGSCSFEDAFSSSGGNIWAGLNPSGGSVWDGFSTSSGIWSGYEGGGASGSTGGSTGDGGASGPTGEGGIWAGLEGLSSGTQPEASEPAVPGSSSSALQNIWAGLLNQDNSYYQPGEENQNVQPGISEAVPAETLLAAADSYFSSASLSRQMIYSLQLNRHDLDHLSAASGILLMRNGDETIRLGNIGNTVIDWSTGVIFSMFNGSWPTVEGVMVRAETLYDDGNGNTRFVIPARINGLKMYLLGSLASDGKTELLGATQGYDENGFAIRGVIPLEAGMKVVPLFTAVSGDGSEREYEGEAFTVPEGNPEVAWVSLPEGEYQYCFGLTDLSGQIHYTYGADF